MDLSVKDIGRIIGAVVLIAIMVFLYYDRRRSLRHKLNGRDRYAVFAEQAGMMKNQIDAMCAIMQTYLKLFQNGTACNLQNIRGVLQPLYVAMDAITADDGYINELFDADTLKLAGECQSLFNDFGFQSNFYDMMGQDDTNPAPPFADDAVKPLYDVYKQDLPDTVTLTPEKYAKLQKVTECFEKTQNKLFERLDKKIAKQVN